MTQDLKPGSRWPSAVDDTEAIVVKPGSGGLTLECGGPPMIPGGTLSVDGVVVPLKDGKPLPSSD